MSILNPKTYYANFIELVTLLTRHKQLTWEMTKRELTDQYLGQLLGWLWTVGHPVFLMGVYVVIFGYVFKLRIGDTPDMPLNYTVYLLSGLIPWMGLQTVLGKSSVAITGNANLVKQVVFPIEILPVKVVLASVITQCISMFLLIFYILFVYKFLMWMLLLLPVLLLLQVMGMIGIAYVFSAIGAYFRDLKDFVQLFCVAGMYLMPIFYLPAWVPNVLRPALYLNPISYMVWCYQDVFYYGRFEHPYAWGVFSVLSLGAFLGGYCVFRKVKILFGNVL